MSIDAEKTMTELVEQIKQIEISIFYTLLNYPASEILFSLSKDDFYSDFAKRYIHAIQSLAYENAETTAITVFDRLKKLKIADESDFSRLIELQTASTVVAGQGTVEIIKKYMKQFKAFKKLQELQQKVIESIEFSNEIDVESIVNEYADFLNEQESESDDCISNSEILQCIKNQDFEQKWLYKDFILTNSINVLDGRGGAKKSRFAIQLAVCATAQLDFLCFQHNYKETGLDYKNVFYITPITENNPRLIANIVYKICNYYKLDFKEILKHLIFIQTPQTLLQKCPRGIETTNFYHELRKLSKQYKPDLIVIDPIARFLGVEFTNENISILYNNLEHLNSTVVLIHHQPKSDLNKKIDETTALGGIMFRELARARFILRENELMIEKNNLSKYFNHIIRLEYDHNNCIFITRQTEPYEVEFVRTMEQHGGNGKGKKY